MISRKNGSYFSYRYECARTCKCYIGLSFFIILKLYKHYCKISDVFRNFNA